MIKIEEERKDKIKEFLNDPSIARLKIFIFIAGLIIAMFMNTDYFQNLDQNWQVIGYIILGGMLLMVGPTAIKIAGVAMQIFDIAVDSKKSPQQKLQALYPLFIKLANLIGLQHEILNDMYGIFNTEVLET